MAYKGVLMLVCSFTGGSSYKFSSLDGPTCILSIMEKVLGMYCVNITIIGGLPKQLLQLNIRWLQMNLVITIIELLLYG